MIQPGAYLLSAFLLLVACGSPGPATKDTASNAKEELVNESHCYLQVTKTPSAVVGTDTFPGTPDSLYVRLDILGELVNGVYDWLPGEKDSKTGSFTGTLENGTVTALYTYDAEGMTAKEEVLFKVDDGGLRIGTGELMESEGVWLFKDKGLAVFGKPIPEVPCLR